MTTAEIATLIAQNVNDNTVGDVTPAELRAVLNALNENQQSGEFESTLTVTGTGTATLQGKLLYHKIGNVVSLSGTIELNSAGASDIISLSLPFTFDATKPFNFTATLGNPLQYSNITTTPTFNPRFGVIDYSSDLSIVARVTVAGIYEIYFSGHYVCV